VTQPQAGSVQQTSVQQTSVQQTSGSQPHTSHTLRLTLNSDGQRHPVINGVAAFTVAAGVVSIVLGLMNVAHFAGTILGVAAFIAGVSAQMISVTTEQRIVIVTGVVAAFVGLGLGIAHGGFSI
jgi:hypothetical protein